MLVKRSIVERGSPWIQALTHPAGMHSLDTVRLAGVELVAALTRRARGGSIAPADAARIQIVFTTHWHQQYVCLPVSAALIEDAMSLAKRYGLRGYDAVHLAAGVSINTLRLGAGLPAIIFLSADAEQLAAAHAEGVPVDDPNHHS